MSGLPTSTIVTFRLHGKGEGVRQDIEMEGSAHIVHVDAAPVFGGKDEYPSPMAYVLGSLISCSQVTAQLVAKDFDVELRSFDFDLAADLDTAVLCGGALEGNPNFEAVGVNVIVETDAPDDIFKKVCEETERRCPLYQLFEKSGSKITYNWSKA